LTDPGIAAAPRQKEGNRFFLEKDAKTFAWLSWTSRRQPCKSFLVLFFKKELLFSYGGTTQLTVDPLLFLL
jgi:hypothetical protein